MLPALGVLAGRTRRNAVPSIPSGELAWISGKVAAVTTLSAALYSNYPFILRDFSWKGVLIRL